MKLSEPPGAALGNGAVEPYEVEGTTDEYGTATPSRLTCPKRGIASTPEKIEVAKARIAVNESEDCIVDQRATILYYKSMNCDTPRTSKWKKRLSLKNIYCCKYSTYIHSSCVSRH